MSGDEQVVEEEELSDDLPEDEGDPEDDELEDDNPDDDADTEDEAGEAPGETAELRSARVYINPEDGEVTHAVDCPLDETCACGADT